MSKRRRNGQAKGPAVDLNGPIVQMVRRTEAENAKLAELVKRLQELLVTERGSSMFVRQLLEAIARRQPEGTVLTVTKAELDANEGRTLAVAEVRPEDDPETLEAFAIESLDPLEAQKRKSIAAAKAADARNREAKEHEERCKRRLEEEGEAGA